MFTQNVHPQYHVVDNVSSPNRKEMSSSPYMVANLLVAAGRLVFARASSPMTISGLAIVLVAQVSKRIASVFHKDTINTML